MPSRMQAMESIEPVLAVRSYGRMKRAGFQADERPASLELGTLDKGRTGFRHELMARSRVAQN